MITPLAPKFEPGARFGYSNAGFVLLGLIVEAAGGQPFQSFVRDTIIKPGGLTHTGFYRMDDLPGNTALGYYRSEDTGWERANIFRLPVLGGADGGLYTCAEDLDKLWRAVFSYQLMSEKAVNLFLTPQVKMYDSFHYGLGVYLHPWGGGWMCYAVGGDFGVDFFTAYFPEDKISVSALGNTEVNTFPLLESVLAEKE